MCIYRIPAYQSNWRSFQLLQTVFLNLVSWKIDRTRLYKIANHRFIAHHLRWSDRVQRPFDCHMQSLVELEDTVRQTVSRLLTLSAWNFEVCQTTSRINLNGVLLNTVASLFFTVIIFTPSSFFLDYTLYVAQLFQ